MAELERASDEFEAQHGAAAWREAARAAAQRQAGLELELPAQQAQLKAYRCVCMRIRWGEHMKKRSQGKSGLSHFTSPV